MHCCYVQEQQQVTFDTQEADVNSRLGETSLPTWQ